MGCPPRDANQGYGYNQPPPGYQQPPPGYQQPPPGYQQPPPGYQQPPPNTQPPGQPPPGTPPGTVPPPPGGAPPPPGGQPPPGGNTGWPFPWPPPPGTTGQPPGGQPPPGGGGGEAGQATLIDPATAQIAVVPLGAYASQEMGGMQPVTDIIAGQFQQGQYLDQPFQMQPNKCYGAVAVGAGISEVHIQFVVLQPIPGVQNPVVAEDQTQGSNAALGGRGKCYTWTFPMGINAKAVYIAQAGGGIAAGRVYVK